MPYSLLRGNVICYMHNEIVQFFYSLNELSHIADYPDMCQEKEKLSFLFLDSFAYVRPVFIKSPTISIVTGIFFSASIDTTNENYC